MTRDASFWRNLSVISLLHVAVLCALLRWSGTLHKPNVSHVVWMQGAVATMNAAIPAAMPAPPELALESTPSPVDTPAAEEPRETAFTAPAPAETEAPLPVPTAIAASTPRPTPAATKPTSKLSAKPAPKKALPVKTAASPGPPKRSVTPAPAVHKPAPKATPPRSDVAAAIKAAASNGTEPTVGMSATAGLRGVGLGAGSQFSWYVTMLHDRFLSQWSQPTSVVRSGAKMSVLVKLRIEKDGRVSRFGIVRSSGNVVVDESVVAAGKRLTQVEPLPSGLGDAPYEPTIDFEFN